MEEIKLWEVGGHVRDHILGKTCKDIDMAVEASSWDAMREFVHKNTKKIFLEKPEFLTIRAMGFDNLPKDFVLCRKDGTYSDNRRPDFVEPGTILDDLSRRDFTVNAIARNPETGEIFDPFFGIADVRAGLIRCVGDTEKRFGEDSLRIIRAFRFSITKSFVIHKEILDVIWSAPNKWADAIDSVSEERIREELHKCFHFNTCSTVEQIGKIFPTQILEVIFDGNLWLEPTCKSRKGAKND